jgi:hypothetical protein
VAELVDATGLGPVGLTPLEVRVLSPASRGGTTTVPPRELLDPRMPLRQRRRGASRRSIDQRCLSPLSCARARGRVPCAVRGRGQALGPGRARVWGTGPWRVRLALRTAPSFRCAVGDRPVGLVRGSVCDSREGTGPCFGVPPGFGWGQARWAHPRDGEEEGVPGAAQAPVTAERRSGATCLVE